MSDSASTSDRISQRILARQGGGLQRRTLSDGGEVFSGTAAKRALKALGARAFTVDNSIIVDDDFDESSPEDMALYAHEVHHQMESGGTDEHSELDSEEQAARQIERMVLHRASSGDAFGAIMRDVRQGGADSARAHDKTPKSNISGSDDPQSLLNQMLASGISYDTIVEDLKREILDRLHQNRELSTFRKSNSTTY